MKLLELSRTSTLHHGGTKQSAGIYEMLLPVVRLNVSDTGAVPIVQPNVNDTRDVPIVN